jgi:hypothetical protein
LGRVPWACYGSRQGTGADKGRADDLLEEPVDTTAHNQSEGPTAPRLGIGRVTFGMTRDLGKRLEVTFVTKNGGTLTAVEELDESLSADVLADYAKQLTKDLAEGRPRTFVDSWTTSGQYTWINLGEVVAFSLRPAK